MSAQIKEARLLRLATTLAIVGLLWHFVEAGIGFYLGQQLDSPTLRGFALDSGVEILAGLVLMARLWGLDLSERRAGQLIGVSFLLIAAWILVDSILSFISPAPQRGSSEQLYAVALAALVILTMYPLAYFKGKVAAELHSDAARAESRQTWLCGHMAWLLVLGVLGPMVGLSFLDGLAALGICALAVMEARRSFRSGPCGCAMHIDGVDYRSLRRLGRAWTDELTGPDRSVYALRWPATFALVLIFALGAQMGAAVIVGGLSLMGLFALWLYLIVLRERIEPRLQVPS